MADENETYVASIKCPITQTDGIVKDVSEKLYGEPNLTMNDLIKYLIKDDGFNETEKEVMGSVENVLEESKRPRKMLGIKALDSNGEYKYFQNKNGETQELISLTEIAKDYFEPKAIDEKAYKGLDLEVHVTPEGSSGLDYILLE